MNELPMIFSKGFVAHARNARRASSGYCSAMVARGITRLSFAPSVHDTHAEYADTLRK